MSLRPAPFPEVESTLTVFLVEGGTRTGRCFAFSPFAEIFLFLAPEPGQEGQKSRRVMIMPESVSYVALHADSKVSINPPPADLAEFDVHLPGDRSIAVRAKPNSTGDKPGFLAWPVNEKSIFALFYFYAGGVKAVESRQRLGDMLVQEGIIDKSTLESGLKRQAQERNALLGQILVEHAVVDEEKLERVAEEQPYQMKNQRPMRLGEILVEAGLATDAQITVALEEQKKRRGKRLGQILVELGVVQEIHISTTLARKFNRPYLDLRTIRVDPAAMSQVPADLVTKYQLLPILVDASTLTIAIADPLAFEGLDLLRFHTRKQIKEVIVTPSQLAQQLAPFMPEAGSIQVNDDEIDYQSVGTDGFQPTTSEAAAALQEDNSGVVALLNRIITDAYQRGASDIHVEPNGPDRKTAIRLRVDGQCETVWRLPSSLRAQIVARLKVMATLNITERRKPQDGKIVFRISKRRIELRVATIPTSAGDEDVVMRILAGSEPLPVEKLLLSDRNRDELERLVLHPHGLVLVVGPTGSGKTTTLHSLLAVLNTEHRKIWTAEDPVEITQAGLRQVQMHSAIGFNFATALRSFLRADPDVIMVGEIRDLETATIAVEASLTGHMVMSTLHTNSAPETVVRLVDMGLDPFMFSDALLGVVAQRLARKLCNDCKVPYEAPPEELGRIGRVLSPERIAPFLKDGALTLYRAVGCPSCRAKGYKGRIGIHELLVTNEHIRAAIQHKEPGNVIRQMAQAGGMTTLLEDGVAKCLQGLTDVAQVTAVAGL